MIVLGWRERVALPELGIPRLRAKIDTGARTSALHVDAQWRFVEAGGPWVGFRVRARGKAGDRVYEARAAVSDERDVVDSGGHRTRRVFIRSPIRLGGQAREAEINLTDRAGMLFPMLLGRSALQDLFVVDPSRSFLHGRRSTPPDRTA